MKNYTITVNGTAYDVTVDEGGNGAAPAAAPPATLPAPVILALDAVLIKSSHPS